MGVLYGASFLCGQLSLEGGAWQPARSRLLSAASQQVTATCCGHSHFGLLLLL